jgi:hypothetical protein
MNRYRRIKIKVAFEGFGWLTTWSKDGPYVNKFTGSVTQRPVLTSCATVSL